MMIMKSEAQADKSVPDSGIVFPFKPSDQFGVPVEIAEGVWWIRLPVDAPLDSVNVYALANGQRLTLVDTGANTPATISALEAALGSDVLKDLPLDRVIVTHFHPDHIGLAGYLANKYDAELWMTRSCWFSCQLLLKTSSGMPNADAVKFMQKAGLTGIQLEAYRRQPVGKYGDVVTPLTDEFHPLLDLDTIRIGSRDWQVVVGNGHATEHATLWCEDLAIVGDQILPGISASLTVPFTEPESDLVSEWLQSCEKLIGHANNRLLVLPGHQQPYVGGLNRLRQIQNNVQGGLQRIQRLLATPKTPFQFVDEFHNRSLTMDERKRLLPEMVGFLNHLVIRGSLERTAGPDGTMLYGPRKSVPALNHIGSPASSTVFAGAGSISNAETQSVFEQTANDTERSTSLRLRRRSALFGGAMLTVSLVAYAAQDKLVGLSGIAADTFLSFTDSVANADSAEKLNVPIITVETCVPVKLESTELPRSFTGVVKAKRTSEVGFNRVGTVENISVERGDRVRKGQILAELNNAMLKANWKAIEAQIEAADARLDEMLAGPRSQTIDVARNEASAAKAELELARKSFDRAQRLVTMGAVSRQEAEEASTALKSKQENWNAAKNTLNELLAGTRTEQVRAQRAVLSELAASKEQISVQMDESIITAPFDAIVAERHLSPGAVVSPGEPVIRLVEVAAPEAWIGLPPEYIDRLAAGDEVNLRIGTRSVAARLKTVLPELERGTRTNTAVFELTGIEPGWGIGRSVEIELNTPMDQSGFWVAMSSIIKGDHGLWAVLALEPVGRTATARLVKRELEVILVDSDRAYVRGTIQEGEEIVSTGLHRLTPGQLVKVKPLLAGRSEPDHPISPTY